MGIVDIIDDRDTYITNETTVETIKLIEKQFKDWLTLIKNELPADSIVSHLGGGRFKIDLPPITCTGSDVETIFNIPLMHQLLKAEIKHVDSAGADSIDALNYSVSHRHHPNLWLILLKVVGSVASDIVDEYIDYYMTRGEYRILTDTTNTDLLYISVYIRTTGA